MFFFYLIYPLAANIEELKEDDHEKVDILIIFCCYDVAKENLAYVAECVIFITDDGFDHCTKNEVLH